MFTPHSKAQDLTLTSTVNVYIKPLTTLKGGDLTIGSNAAVEDQGTIDIEGDWTNNGSFTAATGAVIFTGAAIQALAGSNPTTFYDLNNTGAGIILNQNITVTNNLTLTDGDINLNGDTIELDTTGTLIGETNDKRIYGDSGVIQTTNRNIGVPTALNIAGLGAVLSSAVSMGSATVIRGYAVQSGAGNTSIKRYYDITPSTNSGLNATFRFYYLDANEVNGQDETDFTFWRSDDNGATWSNEGRSSLDNIVDYVELTAINSFSRWTLSNQTINPLPVELLYFTAAKNGQTVLLEWTTLSETNSDYFTVERSADAIAFEGIIEVPGAGNSNTIKYYSVTDENPTGYRLPITGYRLPILDGVSYYRLKQTDYDGTSTYSPVVAINFEFEGVEIVVVYPNPAIDQINYLVVSSTNTMVTTEIIDVKGAKVSGKTESIEKGVSQGSLDISALSKGIYFINISAASGLYRSSTFMLR